MSPSTGNIDAGDAEDFIGQRTIPVHFWTNQKSLSISVDESGRSPSIREPIVCRPS